MAGCKQSCGRIHGSGEVCLLHLGDHCRGPMVSDLLSTWYGLSNVPTLTTAQTTTNPLKLSTEALVTLAAP